MSNQEKYQKLKNIATQIARDKEIIDQKGVERAIKENDIRFITTQSLSKLQQD